ncbi:MAG: hypothetical protein A2X67_14790 [Ignavibacteria bacterium GWA2_55_11]|nr:MAG: hypothetical protein A2X67_14790 [Ignavibacteria bacterium GWA2_55_11]OGU68819.1 MAG: hypothetical protein A3H45_00010 [Ignavibacteria bacterium RIFCSPLOWO2_02_FULL_55_14]OGU76945.1 MAG: hypothetical protein A3G43_13310 [Ignavibacteria bacterium RIFCSPLOWO2_12_FULL_56_21]
MRTMCFLVSSTTRFRTTVRARSIDEGKIVVVPIFVFTEDETTSRENASYFGRFSLKVLA